MEVANVRMRKNSDANYSHMLIFVALMEQFDFEGYFDCIDIVSSFQ